MVTEGLKPRELVTIRTAPGILSRKKSCSGKSSVVKRIDYILQKNYKSQLYHRAKPCVNKPIFKNCFKCYGCLKHHYFEMVSPYWWLKGLVFGKTVSSQLKRPVFIIA